MDEIMPDEGEVVVYNRTQNSRAIMRSYSASSIDFTSQEWSSVPSANASAFNGTVSQGGASSYAPSLMSRS